MCRPRSVNDCVRNCASPTRPWSAITASPGTQCPKGGRHERSLARLSSGSKIVEPQDDAAGLAVASRFDAQINRTEAVRANIG
ncbi:MAG: hypothetical protein ACK50P_14480, partial [Planctomycetaceae bacterium]